MHLYSSMLRHRAGTAEAEAGARRRAPRATGPLRVLATAVLAAGALAGPAAAAVSTPPDASGGYAFKTLNNHADLTFNQLLGINDSNLITGYFGSGMTVNGKLHPNKGYTLSSSHFRSENFPKSVQTQVVGLNNNGTTVGFWVNGGGANYGFYNRNHQFHTVRFPTNNNARTPVDQLLGVNDHDMAVGFYTDSKGNNHGFTYNIDKNRYHEVRVPGDTNVTAAGINNLGDIAGIGTNGAGTTEGFLLRSDGKVIHLQYPGASSTQAFGVNNGDEVVGDYTVGSGNNAQTHGFVWVPGVGFANVDDPNGIGATTLNGINDRGELVGFYTDSAGNTDGLLASPQF
jgi:hypothetical protein